MGNRMRHVILSAVTRLMIGLGALAVLVASGPMRVSSSSHPRYVNYSYGFEVTLPAGLTYLRTSPPNPDHGIDVALHEGNDVWVDATYTDAASTDEEARMHSPRCKLELWQEASLGGLPARLTQISCPAEYGEKAYQERSVLTVYANEDRGPARYAVAARATEGKISARAAELLNALVGSFRFRKVTEGPKRPARP